MGSPERGGDIHAWRERRGRTGSALSREESFEDPLSKRNPCLQPQRAGPAKGSADGRHGLCHNRLNRQIPALSATCQKPFMCFVTGDPRLGGYETGAPGLPYALTLTPYAKRLIYQPTALRACPIRSPRQDGNRTGDGQPPPPQGRRGQPCWVSYANRRMNQPIRLRPMRPSPIAAGAGTLINWLCTSLATQSPPTLLRVHRFSTRTSPMPAGA